MKIVFISALAGLLTLASCGKVPGTGKPSLKTSVDSVSYALGYLEASQFMQQFKGQGFSFDSIDSKMIARAIGKNKIKEEYIKFRKQQFDTLSEDAYRMGFLNQIAYDKNGVFDETTANTLLQGAFNKLRVKKDSLAALEGVENLEEGIKFLESNKNRAGVVTTESGLQYEILKAGNGIKPTANDQVKCTYHGTLIDGTVFDSSVERGDTATFNVGGVIKGWTEALQMMPVGSKWKLYIPSELAYGDRATGDKIKANSALVFEVELVSIESNK